MQPEKSLNIIIEELKTYSARKIITFEDGFYSTSLQDYINDVNLWRILIKPEKFKDIQDYINNLDLLCMAESIIQEIEKSTYLDTIKPDNSCANEIGCIPLGASKNSKEIIQIHNSIVKGFSPSRIVLRMHEKGYNDSIIAKVLSKKGVGICKCSLKDTYRAIYPNMPESFSESSMRDKVNKLLKDAENYDIIFIND